MDWLSVQGNQVVDQSGQERLLAQAPLAPPVSLVQDGLVAIGWEAMGVGATVAEV